MSKIDFKKELKPLYRPSARQFEVVEVPEMQFLMVDGHGNPNTVPAYREAVETLYAVAYKIKFSSKKLLNRDYVVPPLEGLWWAEDMNSFTSNTRDKSQWDFTLMIMQPEWVTAAMFERAVAKVAEKEPPKLLDKVRFEWLDEGACVQTLHIGSFDDETEILDEMHSQFIPDNGYEMSGKHHEIYFSDFRKVAPEKLRTLLRQPVRRKG